MLSKRRDYKKIETHKRMRDDKIRFSRQDRKILKNNFPREDKRNCLTHISYDGKF